MNKITCPDTPCANCKIKQRTSGSYCRECNSNIRYENKFMDSLCNFCGINKKIRGGGHRYCVDCREIAKAQNSSSKPEYKRAAQWKTKYKLLENQVDSLLEKQQFKCPICETFLCKETLHIDHDHNCCPTGKTCGECVRGLLCQTCNVSLGKFKDSVFILNRAIQYLESY